MLKFLKLRELHNFYFVFLWLNHVYVLNLKNRLLKKKSFIGEFEVDLSLRVHSTKALSKQEGPNVCWDACFFNIFFEFESAPCWKIKRLKKRASHQMFGSSYFVGALLSYQWYFVTKIVLTYVLWEKKMF